MATPQRTRLTVRYRTSVPWLFLVIGMLNLPAGLLLHRLSSITTGVLMISLAAIAFSREYFTYTTRTRTLEVAPPLGRRRLFQDTGKDTLVVEGNRIVLVRECGTRKKVPVTRWMSCTSDWDAVAEAIGQKAA
ncbi:hypothetical protein AGRA3207_005322 [Actinomadura graeca]|uniref:PH domain-containing protein n=1 Tax=Actinomadura graeca TaxID=2750812 RepID=A0ABX8R0I0_9ACTN|nr:hypothetical protein [Actinomadura graeca]QXJ24071.1 hypothetical protein AGRA3207_005322 [Actinomadura graeca]